jgi:hypothetical protein
MTLQQLGGYLFDLGWVLSWLHSAEMTALSAFFTNLGLALEGGGPAFTIKVGNAALIGKYIGGVGFVFGLFKFLEPAEAFCVQLGAELALGAGTFGPIRVGNDGISGTVTSAGGGADSIAFTVGAWT